MTVRRALGTASALVATLLVAGCPTTTDDSVTGNTNSNSSTTTGEATAGQTVYTQRCASCHSLGSFDSSGSAGNLRGRSSQVVTNLGSISFSMTGITLTSQEVADLKAFIQTQ